MKRTASSQRSTIGISKTNSLTLTLRETQGSPMDTALVDHATGTCCCLGFAVEHSVGATIDSSTTRKSNQGSSKIPSNLRTREFGASAPSQLTILTWLVLQRQSKYSKQKVPPRHAGKHSHPSINNTRMPIHHQSTVIPPISAFQVNANDDGLPSPFHFHRPPPLSPLFC